MTTRSVSHLIGAILLLSTMPGAHAAASPSPAEALILAGAEKGLLTDLQSLPESARIISSDFLERVVTGKYPGLTINRLGVRIKGALFTQPLDLANAIIPNELWLIKCEFRDTVSFAGVRALRDLKLSGSAFSDAVNFTNLRVDGDLWMDGVTSKRSFTMRDAVIGLDLLIRNAHFFGRSIFSNMNVRHTVNAVAISFHDSADFGHSMVGYNFVLNDATFLHTTETNFNSMSVGHSLFMKKAEFSGPVDLVAVRIGSNLEANAAVFRDSTSFNSIRIGHSLFLKETAFHGAVNLVGADIASNLEMMKCEVSTNAPVTLGNVRIGHIWLLDGCVLKSRLTASGARVGEQLLARGAHFDAGTRLVGLDVGQQVNLSGSKFLGEANFDRMRTGDLVAANCEFGPKHIVSLASIVVRRVDSPKSVFHGGIALPSAQIASTLDLTDSRLGDSGQDTVTFDGLQAGKILLDGATVGARASFNLAQIGYDLSAVGITFLASAPVRLHGINIQHDIRLSNATFTGGVEFYGAQIHGALSLHSAKIGRNARSRSSFAGMKVDDRVDLVGATFTGPVDFHLSSIGLNLDADGVQFVLGTAATEAEFAYVFNSMRVGHTVSLAKARFDNSVDFAGSRIAANLYLAGARFTSADAKVKFDSVTVGAGLSLQEALFAGPTSFRQASVGSTLDAVGATFTNPSSPPDFSNARIAAKADFTKATFAAGVSLNDGHYLDLSIKSATGLEKSRLMLARTVVGRDLTLEDLSVGEVVATGLNVAGPAHFTSVRVERLLDLQHARFNTLFLEPVPVPILPPTKPGQGALLDGLTYQRLSPGEGGDWKSLLRLASLARYNAQIFADLEAFFAREGYVDRANDVFVAQKALERRQLFNESQWVSNLGPWSWNALLWAIARNGRWPLLAWGWACVFVVIGFFVFRRQDWMEVRDSRDIGKVYSPIWYSIDVLLPVLDLESEKVWTPKPSYWLGLLYVRLETIAGWILIPIGLASLTGIIK